MNTSHYPSLELCKKLTEIGFPDTEKDYVSNELNGVIGHHIGKDGYLPGDYVCPSPMELLDEMPKSIETDNLEYYLYYDFTNDKVYYTSDNCGSCEAEILMEYFGDNIPNALAEMYLWLKNNNYLP